MKREEQQRQAALRKQHNLPSRCECGGRMSYDYDFGRVFSHCLKCTPVIKVDVDRLMGRTRVKQNLLPSRTVT